MCVCVCVCVCVNVCFYWPSLLNIIDWTVRYGRLFSPFDLVGLCLYDALSLDPLTCTCHWWWLKPFFLCSSSWEKQTITRKHTRRHTHTHTHTQSYLLSHVPLSILRLIFQRSIAPHQHCLINHSAWHFPACHECMCVCWQCGSCALTEWMCVCVSLCVGCSAQCGTGTLMENTTLLGSFRPPLRRWGRSRRANRWAHTNMNGWKEKWLHTYSPQVYVQIEACRLELVRCKVWFGQLDVYSKKLQ